LRAERARGKWSLLTKQNAEFIRELLVKASREWRVKVYEFANSGTHLHLLLKAETREGFANLLRVLGAQVATYVTRARRGNALGFRFWDLPAWSRLVETDFPIVRAYIIQNRLEAEGLIPYTPRRKKRLRGGRPQATAPFCRTLN